MAGEERRTAAAAQDYRDLPSNLDVERAMIGAIFVSNDAYRRVSQIVDETMFHEDLHRRIWAVIRYLIEKGQIVTPAIAATYLPKVELVPGVTPGSYCVEVMGAATTVVNAEAYARTIRDLHFRRLLVGAYKDALELAYDAPDRARRRLPPTSLTTSPAG